MPSPTSQAKIGQNNPSPGFNIPMPQFKKAFSQRDKDKFLDESFEVIKTYFSQGIKKLNELPEVDADFKEITNHKFICKFYIQGELKSACTIWIGGWIGQNGINYVSGANPDANNSINESLSVEPDNNSLFLKPLMNVYNSKYKSKLTVNEAAEYLWSKATNYLNNK